MFAKESTLSAFAAVCLCLIVSTANAVEVTIEDIRHGGLQPLQVVNSMSFTSRGGISADRSLHYLYKRGMFRGELVQHGVTQFVYAFNGEKYQQLSPLKQILSLRNGPPPASILPLGTWNPFVFPYYWLIGPGEPRTWSNVVNDEIWMRKFLSAKNLRSVEVDGKDCTAIDFPLENGRVCSVFFTRMPYFFPVRTTIRDGDRLALEIRVVKTKLLSVSGQPLIVPIVVDYFSMKYEIDAESLRINHAVNSNRFTIPRSEAKHVFDFNYAENVFEDNQNGLEELNASLERARLRRQHVLVFFGNDSCTECKTLSKLLQDDGEIKRKLYDFTLLHVPNDAASSIELRHQLEAPDDTEACLVIVNLQGHLQDTFAVGSGVTKAQVMEFLSKNRPETIDAKDLLAQALAQAHREDKCVLICESGSACSPCLLLERFLEDFMHILRKDFVRLTIDPIRNEHGREIIRRYRSRNGGIPWMLIVDKNGDEVSTSDGPNGNIGFPSTNEGIEHFEAMLRQSAKRLTDDDFKQLTTELLKRGTAGGRK